MGFAYKKLKQSDKQSAPYIANKQYTIASSSYSENNITIYVGENIPITEDNPFDPINDNQTADGNYRRLIFDSIRHLFYQNYVTKSTEEYPYPDNTNKFWHSSSYDNFEQTNMASGAFSRTTVRKLPFFTSSFFDYDASSSIYDLSTFYAENNAKIRVMSIPQDIYGNGIEPYSFNLSGSSYLIQDDGQGNLWDMTGVRTEFGRDDGEFGGGEYALTRYFDNDNKIYVGNIFYNQGLVTITNEDYLCFAATEPVAKNNYYDILNVQKVKDLDILASCFDDCDSINTGSVGTIAIPGKSFPDFAIQSNGNMLITPNLAAAQPGEYKIDYTVDNNLGLTSNTASITLNLTSQPLSSSVINLTQSCWQSNTSSSLTFSADFGIPPYSYSFDQGVTYTPITDIYQPIVSASVLPTRSFALTIKDSETTYTQYLETALLPISGAIYSQSVSYCNSNDGIFFVSGSGSGSMSGVSASLSASFSNSVLLPNTFSGLTVGTYNVYFKDANGCVTSSEVEMGKTQYVTLSYDTTNNICFSGSIGSLILDDFSDDGEEIPITGGQAPFTWSWTGPDGFTSASEDIINLKSGSYTLDLYDTNQCTYSFNFDMLSPQIISYTSSIDYSNPVSSSILLENLAGGTPPYSITASTGESEYLLTASSVSSLYIGLDADQLNSGSASISIIDDSGCSLISASVKHDWQSGSFVSSSSQTGTSSIQEIFGREWVVTGSFCEDGTGSVSRRNLNFYTLSGSNHWVTAKIQSGSETPIELATSGSATASYVWNTNDPIKIFVETGSNDAFSLRREFNGALTESQIYVTANSSSGQNEFYIDGAETASISLFRSTQYIFDQSDSSNAGHHLAFSTTGSEGGVSRTIYNTGVRYTGLAGSTGKVIFDVASNAPDRLYYFCTSHSLMGGNNTMSLFDKASTLVTQSSITSSAIITGSNRLDYTSSNLDVSLPFGFSGSLKNVYLTASKVNTEENTTEINFIFDRQVPLYRIRDLFTGSAANLALTGSGGTTIGAGSGSKFIARSNEFTDIKYGNTGSFIGPNSLLFRKEYAFGNYLNTISGSSLEYTSGSVWSGSVSASILGGAHASYFTQRTDKAWLLTADVDSVSFLDVYSYTSASFYENDPLGTRTNLTPYDYEGHTIYAATQAMPEDLFYIMIIRKDEDTSMNFPSGIGGGEVFQRKLEFVNDVNRIYYLFMSPTGSSSSQSDIDNRCISIGKYFIDNVING